MRCGFGRSLPDAIRVMMQTSSTGESTMRGGISLLVDASRHGCARRRSSTRARGIARRRGIARNKFLGVLVLLVLIRIGDSHAGEPTAFSFAPPKPDFKSGATPRGEPLALTTPTFELPKTYQAIGPVTEDPVFPGDFRPRRRPVMDREPDVAALEGAPMSNGASVWQRLGEYRSHGRVRLLTLWETGGSSVSLQAGKKGEPSLQWTSHSMNHGGATRGLFDQLLPAAMTNGGRSSHGAAHPAISDPATRPIRQSDAGMGTTK
jgi:hypothetical protein